MGFVVKLMISELLVAFLKRWYGSMSKYRLA